MLPLYRPKNPFVMLNENCVKKDCNLADVEITTTEASDPIDWPCQTSITEWFECGAGSFEILNCCYSFKTSITSN